MYYSPFLIKVLRKLKLQASLNGYSIINVKKQEIRIPILGTQGISNLELGEPWMTVVLENLRPLFGGSFIDIGVNLGQTLIKVHAVFDRVKYVGFEPNPTCVHYVQELIALNALKEFTILPIAVGKNTEILKLTFFGDDASDSAASIVDNFRPDNKKYQYLYVPVFNIHSIVEFLPAEQFSIIKIDVEGAESDVLIGFKDWIKAYKPLLIVEILPVYSVDNDSRLKRQIQIEEMMHDLNYKIARIKKGEFVHLEDIEAIGIHSSIEDSDYLLYPFSLTDEVLDCFRK
jgi:FkbM family methyltransferase